SKTSSMLAEIEAGLAKLREPVPARIFGIPMFDRTWATCLTARTKSGEDNRWLHPLPGIVAVCDRDWQLLDARPTEDVGGLVRIWRDAGAYEIRGACLAWTYCDGQDRLNMLIRFGLKIVEREVEDIRRSARQTTALRELEVQVGSLARQIG